MASLICSRIEEVDRKAKTLLSQLKTSGQMNHKDLIALKSELTSKTFKEEVLEECKDENKSAVNTDVLFSVVSNFYELIECLEQKVSTLSKDVRELMEKVKEANEKLETWKGGRNQLILGQLAFEVEKAIVNEVLAAIIGSPDKYYITTIADMQSALEKKAYFSDVLADDSNHKNATKRWKDLQMTLEWKDYHFRCISHLKRSRVPAAHPKFEAAEVTKAIKEGEVGHHEKACTELLMMLEKLQRK